MFLIQKLRQLQERHGFLEQDALHKLARTENVPLYRLQELISFYPHFRTKPISKVEISVCRDMSCWLGDGESYGAKLQELACKEPDVEIVESSCLGRCEIAPAALHNNVPVCSHDLLDNNLQPGRCTHEKRTSKSWRSDPYTNSAERFGLLGEIIASGKSDGASRIITALKDSGLRGMGGAGFPTGNKWDLVRNETHTPKYVICNADESEPGTFKDRVILADLAHLVVEGMILAGFVIGAESGILYIRHEYEPEQHAFEQALDFARNHGWLGKNIGGTGFHFDIEVFVSPGGYILGEETALLEALEDKRGEPRNKPPYPGTHGLFGQPTLINNVETFAFVSTIVKRGAKWWRDQGKGETVGLKFMAVSGHIEKPNVYEVPMGTTVRQLIDMAGGVKDGKNLKAFAPGGASSNFLPADRIDVPLDFKSLADAGSMLGSGALVVVAEGTDMTALATNVVRFFRNESCGKCVPCRLGSQYAVELLEDVQNGKRERTALDMLPELGETLLQTSICGLGQVALNPILSVMEHFGESETMS